MKLSQKLVKQISSHLSLMVILPCVLLGMVISYDVYLAYSRMQNAYDAEYNAFSAHGVLGVVHEVQKERGMTAGFIGSNGNKFANQLIKQRSLVDDKFNDLLAQRQQWQLSNAMAGEFDKFVQAFDNIRDTRNKVDGLRIALPDALAFYTNINSLGLHSVITGSKLTKEQEISNELFSIYNFSYAKESAGIERAVLSNVLAKDAFTPALRIKHTQLTTKQDVFLLEALEAAPDKMRAIFDSALNNSASQQVTKIRELVAKTDSNFNYAPEQWFDFATQRINALKDAEEQALHLVDETAIKIQQQAVWVLLIEIAILVIGVLITLALYLSIKVRHIQSNKISEGINIALQQRDMSHEIDIVCFDELGEAATGINNLTRLFEKDLKEFLDASNKITTSTHETAVAISQSQTNLIDQKTGVQVIASAAEQMNVNVGIIAESMTNNAESVAEVVKDSVKGKAIVTEAVKVIQSAAQDMESSAAAIHSLNEQVGNITTMVEMIRGIAEQTNLLALNAAIEAARAGEQGRGFAVVADEVRGLASRTQSSTEDISNIVEQLQKDSSHAFEIINKGKDNAMYASDQAELIKEALDRITNQVEEVKAVTDSVSINTNEQAKAIDEVNHNIVKIFEQATENVAGAEQIAVAASNIAESAMTMDDQIERYTVNEEKVAS